jgi:hypothetical protein
MTKETLAKLTSLRHPDAAIGEVVGQISHYTGDPRLSPHRLAKSKAKLDRRLAKAGKHEPRHQAPPLMRMWEADETRMYQRRNRRASGLVSMGEAFAAAGL